MGSTCPTGQNPLGVCGDCKGEGEKALDNCFDAVERALSGKKKLDDEGMQEAMELFHKAVARIPVQASNLKKRAEALRTKAMAALEDAEVPYTYEVFIALGNVSHLLGEEKQAVALFSRALRKKQTREAHNNKGVALARMGRIWEALEAYGKALELEPQNAQTWFNKGKALARMENVAEALEAFENATLYNPQDKSAWNNRGVMLRKLGRLEEALDCYVHALKVAPRYVWAWNNKGVVLEQLGRNDEAGESYRRALEINPRYGPAIENLQRLMARNKRQQ